MRLATRLSMKPATRGRMSGYPDVRDTSTDGRRGGCVSDIRTGCVSDIPVITGLDFAVNTWFSSFHEPLYWQGDADGGTGGGNLTSCHRLVDEPSLLLGAPHVQRSSQSMLMYVPLKEAARLAWSVRSVRSVQEERLVRSARSALSALPVRSARSPLPARSAATQIAGMRNAGREDIPC
jgi:hypothetical protein